jgi:hypothetical protein
MLARWLLATAACPHIGTYEGSKRAIGERFWISFLLTLDHYNGFEVLTTVVMKSYIFWAIMTCSSLKLNRRFGGTCCLQLQDPKINQSRHRHEADSKQSFLMLISCLSYSSTLKIEATATCSLETSVEFQRAMRLYIPEDRTPYHDHYSPA